MKELLELVYTPRSYWNDSVRDAFNSALRARFPRVSDLTDRKSEEKRFQLRVNAQLTDEAVPYAALIPPGQELSGPYGGMSFVMFPADENGKPALVCMGIGTNGLAPDETILGRPGHARKCGAISTWLNQRGQGGFAWAKRDPVRIDLEIPQSVDARLDTWEKTSKRYGKVLYAIYVPPSDRTAKSDEVVVDALKAFVDLFFQERRIEPKAEYREDAERIRDAWMERALPNTSDEEVGALLRRRRFVVIEGPPGTGKTAMARRLLHNAYGGNGREIQFHPGTTYESFIGGLAPSEGGTLGFTFRATAGHLMQAASEARKNPQRRYLLLIDEINRADLSKVLGEAIYLFEPGQPDREIHLPYEFDDTGSRFSLPTNLDVVGTMNTADRSIAILDVAVRRRFAFVALWPQFTVVADNAGERLQSAFQELASIFLEHASNDALFLLPGHSYFFGSDDEAPTRLTTEVRPLLEEYLAQGYVAGFGDELRAYLDSVVQRS